MVKKEQSSHKIKYLKNISNDAEIEDEEETELIKLRNNLFNRASEEKMIIKKMLFKI